MRKYVHTIVIISLIYLTGCASSYVRQHPEIESQLKLVDSVIVIPPTININEHDFDGETHQLEELETKIREDLLNIANETLKSKGYDVITFDFNKEIETNEEFAYALTQIQDSYAEAKKALYDEAQIASTEESTDNSTESNLVDNNNESGQGIPDNMYRANVGTATNMITEITGADSLLLMNYTGAKKSGGNIAGEIFVGVLIGVLTGYVPAGSSHQSSYIEAALIDNKNGNILWNNQKEGTAVTANVARTTLDALPADID